MRKKRILYTAGIALAAIVITSTFVTETKATALLGGYGNLKAEISDESGVVIVTYDCVFSLKANCRRSDW